MHLRHIDNDSGAEHLLVLSLGFGIRRCGTVHDPVHLHYNHSKLDYAGLFTRAAILRISKRPRLDLIGALSPLLLQN